MKLPSTTKIWRLTAMAFVILVVGFGLALHALVGQTKADDDNDGDVLQQPNRVTIKNGTVFLSLSKDDQQNVGILCARLNRAPDEDLVVGLGTVLNIGSLADLRSRYLDAKAQVETANTKLSAAQEQFGRAERLYEYGQTIAKAQLENTEGDLNIDKAAVATAQAHLNSAKATVGNAWGVAIETALVNDAPWVADLLRQRNYLVRAVLPSNVEEAAPPIAADAILNGDTKTRLTYLSPANATDPRIGGMSYFYIMPARDGVLPGRNFDVSLAFKSAEQRWIVPSSAVIWVGEQAWIYVRANATTFVRHKIDSIHPGADDGYIVTGVHPNDEVVLIGAAMLLSEEYRTQMPADQI